MLTFGELLRQLREARHLTQGELGELAGLSRRGIQDLERGVRLTPHLATVRRLADGLHLNDIERAALTDARHADGGPHPAALVAHSVLPVTNLPAPLTSFVGREGEVARLLRVVEGSRLVTLTGPGGVGKTRLALRVAADALSSYADGVWLVRLDALVDSDLVAAAVASVLNVREQAGIPLIERLLERISSRRLMLVLDNCEHLLGACADLALALLRTSHDLRILATSREPLSIDGEVTWRVRPLSIPDAGALLEPASLANFEAVRLFVERSSAVDPEFSLRPRNSAAVAEICRRLDGIPLALELAAARLPVLGVEGIAAHLDDRFRLLHGRVRSAASRHQTLKATLEWSYLLLSAKERLLLQRLSVCAGGCTLECAESFCADESPAPDVHDSCERVDSRAVLDLLELLVAKSLVVAESRTDGNARYRLLESVRAYAQERLAEQGATATIRRRHAQYFLALAESAEPRLRGGEQGLWLHRLEQDHDNLRTALEWALEHRDTLFGLRLGGALSRFWYVRGYLHEGRAYFDRLLGLSPMPGDGRPRALAINGAGNLAWTLGDFAHAEVLLRRSLTLWRDLRDERGMASNLYDLSKVASDRGDSEGARRLAEQALERWRSLGDSWGAAAALNLLGELRREQGDVQSARVLYEQSLELFLGVADVRGRAVVTHNLAIVAAAQGDYDRAAALHREILPLKQELGDREGIVCSLINIAQLGMILGAPEYAVRLCSAAENERARIGAILPTYERKAFAQTVQEARRTLDGPTFEAVWESSRSMALDAAIASALVPQP